MGLLITDTLRAMFATPGCAEAGWPTDRLVSVGEVRRVQTADLDKTGRRRPRVERVAH